MIFLDTVTQTNKTNEFLNIRRRKDFKILICFLTHFTLKPQQNTRSAGARSPQTNKTGAFLPAVLLMLQKRMHLILLKSETGKTKVCVCACVNT